MTSYRKSFALLKIQNDAWAADLRYFTNQDIDIHPNADQWTNGANQTDELTRLMKVRRAALVVRAPEAITPPVFHWAGWIIVVTAVLLAILPLRWHAGYAQWWSRNLPLPLLKVGGVVALALAGVLARAALG